MKIVRWNPRVNRMRHFNEFDRYMNRYNGFRRLPLDVTEDEEGYVVTATVAGINAEDINITIEDNVLTIKGEKVDAWHARVRSQVDRALETIRARLD